MTNARNFGNGLGDHEESESIDYMKKQLEAKGYVVIKRKSYDTYQTVKRVAENRAEWEKSLRVANERTVERIAQDLSKARERITFLYGEARARGASVGELSGNTANGEGEPTCDAVGQVGINDLGKPMRPGMTWDGINGAHWTCNLPKGHLAKHHLVRFNGGVVHEWPVSDG